MNASEIEKLKIFVQMKRENIKPKSIKNILGLSDDEYRKFSGIMGICSERKPSYSSDYVQPDLFNRSRKYVAEFLLQNPFKFSSTEDVANGAGVSPSTVLRAFRDYPEIKDLLLKEDTKDLSIENVGFHKQTTKKAINLIKDNYFERRNKISKEELTEKVGFSRKACQSFLTRFPNFAVLVKKEDD